MRLEFLYVALSIVLSLVYYLIAKKHIFDRHVHSNVLIKAMTVDMALNIVFSVLCLITLLTIYSASKDMEMKYVHDIFSFLLRSPSVKRKSILCMNFSLYIYEIMTMIVAVQISLKRKGHKNLKLERILTSNCYVCVAFTILSTLAMCFSLLLFI